MGTATQIFEAFSRCGKVSTDTRKIDGGELFFALRGDNFNGNKFAAKALEAGAETVVIDDPEYHHPEDPRYILTDDSLLALQDLARQVRRGMKIPFVGITGSNGKTTTKELMHAAISEEKACFATQGNLNNHIGVPLTLLSIPPHTEVAIIEMGANKPGDIDELVHIALPDFGLITNVGNAHLEQMGGLSGVAKTKGELFDYIRSDGGCVWVNEADERVAANAEGIECTVGYGAADSAYRIGSIEPVEGGSRIGVFAPHWQGEMHFTIRLFGPHNAQNALAAIVAASELGISPEGIRKGLEAYEPKMNRSQFVEKAGLRILLDAYNANPSSMEATLRAVFRQYEGRIAVVLGDMFELGDYAEAKHRKLGELVGELQPALFLAFGPLMKHAREACPGVSGDWFEKAEDACEVFADKVKGMDLVLIKGSRGMALERLMEYLG